MIAKHASRSGPAGRSRLAPMTFLVLVAIASGGPAWAVRRQKTVFLSQPSDWTPLMDGDHKLPSLDFQTAWTWGGFKAPLAGDPVACAGSIVAASRDGEIAALDPLNGRVSWRIGLEEPLGVGPATDGTLLILAGS